MNSVTVCFSNCKCYLLFLTYKTSHRVAIAINNRDLFLHDQPLFYYSIHVVLKSFVFSFYLFHNNKMLALAFVSTRDHWWISYRISSNGEKKKSSYYLLMSNILGNVLSKNEIHLIHLFNTTMRFLDWRGFVYFYWMRIYCIKMENPFN